MNRRGFIYRLAFVPPVLALGIEGCSRPQGDWERIEMLVASLRKVILPSGDGIDIARMGLESFVLTMLQDCHSPKEHIRFFVGMEQLDEYCKRNCGVRFESLGKERQVPVVSLLNAKDAGLDKDVVFLYGKVKSKIIQGFQQSELLMKDMGKYELVPGRYNGHYKIV